jgi:hypothetical protein
MLTTLAFAFRLSAFRLADVRNIGSCQSMTSVVPQVVPMRLGFGL